MIEIFLWHNSSLGAWMIASRASLRLKLPTAQEIPDWQTGQSELSASRAFDHFQMHTRIYLRIPRAPKNHSMQIDPNKEKGGSSLDDSRIRTWKKEGASELELR